MRTAAVPRTPRTTLAVLATTVGLLAFAGSAQAAPGTVTGPSGLSLEVSDTTPAPGEGITFEFTYTVRPGDVGDINIFAFGDGQDSGQASENLQDLSFVTCGDGGLVDCGYDLTRTVSKFQGVSDASSPAAGTVISGGAAFTVSSSATDGEHISMFGHHANSGTGDTQTSRLTLTIGGPRADLGVGLTATGSLLGSTINYDAAVTNNGPAAATSATITTQLSSQATSITSSTCTFSATTHQASCPIGALANGATTHARFTANFGLLSLGALNATATRTASAPTDPNAANDSATANCTAVTSLLITC
ncbi:DUF11 domain-containing protein [Conexibacter woesei]|uniref:DUF11 domain-containing protein n=1 Tax=Conexibacter woesei TaxID=191495 RepID=UPI000415CA9D|nr:DUF11 domain-containing protein [Conexibacter woesei]